MLNFGKEPYEISIWEDTLLDNNGNILPYYREKKIAVIGSNTMDSAIKTFDETFVEKTDGSKTLTFKMYYKYNEDGELKDNPLIPYMKNERKVKVWYDDEWYEFLIRDISENKQNYTFTYLAKDSSTIELSKNGFNQEFDDKLENNQGTACELGQKVLAPTDWQLIDNNGTIDGTTVRSSVVDDRGRTVISDCIIQESPETLIEYSAPSSVYAYAITVSAQSGTQIAQSPTLINFAVGDKIFVFYSDSTRSDIKEVQFIYLPGGAYETDSDKNITNGQYYLLKAYNGNEISTSASSTVSGVYDIKFGNSITFTALRVSPDYRGKKYIISNKTIYDPLFDKYATIYKDPTDNREVYVFEETNISAPDVINNYVTNYKDFTSIYGWGGGFIGNTAAQKTQYNVKADIVTGPDIVYKLAGRTQPLDGTYIPWVHGELKGTASVVMNTGPRDNRSAIKTYSNGEQYTLIFRAKLYDSEISPNATSLGNMTSNPPLKARVVWYDLNSAGGYDIRATLLEFNSFTISSDNQYYIATAQCSQDFTEAQTSTRNIGLFFTITQETTKHIYIEEAWFYKTQGSVSPLDNLLTEPVIVTSYKGYKPSLNVDTALEDIAYCCSAATVEEFNSYGYILQKNENSEKILSIRGKNSNYYNLIQSICETFECWARFTVLHNANGSVKMEEYPAGSGNYRKCRYITFHKFIGQPNYAGFRYGVNVNNIERKLNSDAIVSKLIVKQNSNKFGKDGFCTIARAYSNPTKQNAIFNFDHYINNGLLDENSLFNDLWGNNGYYHVLKEQSVLFDEKTEKIERLNSILFPLNTKIEEAKAGLPSAAQQLAEINQQMYDAWGCYYEDFMQGMSEEITTFQSAGHVLAWSVFNNLPKTYNSWVGVEAGPSAQKTCKEWIAKAATLTHEYNEYSAVLDETNPDSEISRYNYNKALIDQLNADREQCVATIREKDTEFYTKYHRFIQEGSWISEDYIDDEKYYLDSVEALYKAAFPKLTYTINVIDLAALEEFEGYRARIGDKTYIEDTEYFGYVIKNGVKTPYQEEIVVTEISRKLSDPSKNTIQVQNYKTEFQDLFHRLAATTQQVKYTTGEYDRASAAIGPDLSISQTYLMNSFENNALIVKNAANESVVIADDGLTTTNKKNPSNIVRLVSGGLYMSDDGGKTWTLGIGAEGINTKRLMAGSIDVGIIQIYDGTNPSFRWDKDGINAYADGATGGYDYTKGVRHDKFGVYGFDGVSWETVPQSVDDVISKQGVKFALTWKGFMFRHGGNGNTIQIGDLGNSKYGIDIYHNNVRVFGVDDNGDAYFAGSGEFRGGVIGEYGQIGGWTLSSLLDQTHPGALYYGGMSASDGYAFFSPNPYGSLGIVLSIGSNFQVDKTGTLTCTNGIFNGEVNADSGRIGDCYISNGSLTIPSANITGTLALTRITSSSTDSPVTFDGQINCSNIRVSGSSRIAGWYVSGSKLYRGLSSVTGNSTGVCLDADKGIGIFKNDNNYFRFNTDGLFEMRKADRSGLLFQISNDYVYCRTIRTGLIQAQAGGGGINAIIFSGGLNGNSLAYLTLNASQIRPGNSYSSIGASSSKWANGYFTNLNYTSITQDSDRRLKKNISPLSASYKILFDNIEVRSYNFIKEGSQRIHIGVIAQDLEQAIKNSGLQNLACVSYDEEADKYGVSYTDISMLHLAHYKNFLKDYEKEIDELKKEIYQLKYQLQNLQKELN